MLRAEAARSPSLDMLIGFSIYFGGPNTIVLKITMANDGDADAENVVLNVLTPGGSSIFRCEDEHGNSVSALRTASTDESVTDEDTPSTYASDTVRVNRGIPTTAFLRIAFPGRAEHRVRVKLMHPQSRVTKDIVIPPLS